MDLTYVENKTDLIINKLSRQMYKELKLSSAIHDDEIYLIDDDGIIDAGGGRIISVAAPEVSSDAANKAYVDAVSANIPTKVSQLTNDSGYLTQHQSLSEYYTKSQTNALSTAFRSGLATTDYAASVGPVTKVNNQTGAVSVYVPTKLSEFTNDWNFISSVPDTYKTYADTKGQLSTDGYAVKSDLTKINLDGTETHELNVVHMARSEYTAKVKADDGSILSNTIYILSAEDVNAYGQKITNVGEPTLSGDAATKNYVDDLSNTYQIKGDYLTEHQSLSNYYTKAQTNSLSTTFRNGLATTSSLTAYQPKGDYLTEHQSLSAYQLSSTHLADIQLLSAEISSKVIVDGKYAENIEMIHINVNEYAELLSNGTVLSNTLYIVNADNLDAEGERLLNVATPVQDTDAANKAYVDEEIESNRVLSVSQLVNDSGFTTNQGTITGITMNGSSLGTSGNVNLGTVITEHQSLSAYQLSSNHAIDIQALSNAISSKVSLDGNTIQELNITNIDISSYMRMVEDGMILSDMVYIVSSDGIDAEFKRIQHVDTPVEYDDAATKGYVDLKVGTTPTTSNNDYKLIKAQLQTCGSGLSCQLSNYTITTITINNPSNAISVVLPEQTSNNIVRDFMIRFENTGSSNATVAFVPYNNEDVDYEGTSDDWADIEPGVNLISFTETKR